jgi:hypothetical protein
MNEAGPPSPGTRPAGRVNYPVQKKFVVGSARRNWLILAAHATGPRVGYVNLLRTAIDVLAADENLLGALRAFITDPGPSERGDDQTITVNLTGEQSRWLRLAAHRTGDEGITQHQLVHALIDWLAASPKHLATIRSAVTSPP